MTISTTASLVVYEGNGATTTFDYAFLIPAATDVVVTYTDADGVSTDLNTSQYSITGINNASGGTVTYPLTGSPIANLTFLSIRRELPLTQETDFVNQDGFYPQVLEDALDYLTMLVQQVNTVNTQAIRVPADEDPPDELPAAALRANQTLVFDADGQPTVGSVTGTTVSSAMQPVVGAATTASARTLMGVGYVPSAVTTNQTIALANITTRYMATGALNFTMPDTTQVPAGFSFSVYALTADCTLTPAGTDTIFGYSLGGAATASAGTVVEAVTDGAGNWWLTTVVSTDDFVGAIRPYGGFFAPSAKYKICDGTSYLRSDFPACFTAIVMSLTVTKTNGSPVLGGFTSVQTAALAAGMLVEGTGIPSGATILTTPSGGDTSITLNQNATNSTSQTATIIPYGAADTTHFNIPDLRGRVLAGAEPATNAATRLTTTYFGSVPRIGRSGTATESGLVLKANLPSVGTFAVTDNRTWALGSSPIVSTGGGPGTIPGGTGATVGSATVTPSGAAPTAAIGGSDTPITKVQPTLVANYLIRVLP
jgi:hypothetical protein